MFKSMSPPGLQMAQHSITQSLSPNAQIPDDTDGGLEQASQPMPAQSGCQSTTSQQSDQSSLHLLQPIPEVSVLHFSPSPAAMMMTSWPRLAATVYTSSLVRLPLLLRSAPAA